MQNGVDETGCQLFLRLQKLLPMRKMSFLVYCASTETRSLQTNIEIQHSAKNDEAQRKHRTKLRKIQVSWRKKGNTTGLSKNRNQVKSVVRQTWVVGETINL